MATLPVNLSPAEYRKQSTTANCSVSEDCKIKYWTSRRHWCRTCCFRHIFSQLKLFCIALARVGDVCFAWVCYNVCDDCSNTGKNYSYNYE